MRFYQYVCYLKHEQEEYRETDKRNDPVRCNACGRRMKLQVAPVAGIVKSPAVPRKFTKRVR